MIHHQVIRCITFVSSHSLANSAFRFLISENNQVGRQQEAVPLFNCCQALLRKVELHTFDYQFPGSFADFVSIQLIFFRIDHAGSECSTAGHFCRYAKSVRLNQPSANHAFQLDSRVVDQQALDAVSICCWTRGIWSIHSYIPGQHL